MGAAIFVTHRANIARILKGEEPRIGKSKPA
jgi:glycerol-3-phosphate acyltransferase PlsY